MPLAVSNIAWEKHDDAEVLALLKKQGVSGIEIAPTKVWPDWQGATVQAAKTYKDFLANEGFSIPAMQAILFGRPTLTVFGDEKAQSELKNHISKVADLAQALGARVLVFGAPKNRDKGNLSNEEAFARAAQVFSALGTICAERKVMLCIEPNPTAYGCNFITTASAGAKLVKAVNSHGFGLHLDAAGMYLAKDDAAAEIKAAPYLCHFHASEPELGNFSAPQVNHAANGEALAEVKYNHWVSIEMRATADALAAIETACTKVKQFYQEVL